MFLAIKIKLRWLLIVPTLLIGLVISPSVVFATAYGGGSYNNCGYGPSCPGGTSSSPSSSSAPTSSSSSGGQDTLLNDFPDYSQPKGKTLNLAPKQVVYFDVKDSSGALSRYSVTIKQVGKDFVILITPDGTEVKFYVGDTHQYDVNKDGKEDIEITLNSITNGKGNFTFKQLDTSTPTITGPASQLSGPTNYFWIVVWSICLLAGLLFLLILFGRRRKRKDQDSPNL